MTKVVLLDILRCGVELIRPRPIMTDVILRYLQRHLAGANQPPQDVSQDIFVTGVHLSLTGLKPEIFGVEWGAPKRDWD